MMMVVPRSDCVNSKNNVGTATYMAALIMVALNSAPSLRSSMRLAAMSTMAILANSEGCSEKGPMTIQRWAPRAAAPKRNVMTSSATHTAQ